MTSIRKNRVGRRLYMNDIMQTSSSNYSKNVVFTIANEEYGFDILLINAIEKYSDIVRIPNAPSFIRGIINLRDEVVPVYSLREKFNLPLKEIDEHSKLIVTKFNDILVAFEVDEVKGIVEIPKNDVNETPELLKSSNTSYIQCVANVKGKMVLLLNYAGILSEQEQRQVETFIANQ